jgi:hypothetical protein
MTELAALGYRVVGVPVLPLLSLHRALRQTYEKLAAFELDPALGDSGAEPEMKAVHQTVDLERLLEIERRTVEI